MSALPAVPNRIGDSLPALAAEDWVRAARMWRLWTALGMEDLRDRYRRTLFGISWVLTSFALFVFVKILVFGQMAAVSMGEFALFVTIGFGLWTFISTVVVDCCLAYTSSKNWLLGASIPYPVFFLQVLFRNWLVFTMILLVMAGVLVWKKETWSPVMLAALPGLLVYLITPVWLAAILAPLCARYRDLLHTVQVSIRLLFFITPILWIPKNNVVLVKLANYNLVTHFIEIVRQPLIHDMIPWTSWWIVLLANAVGVALGATIYVVTRNRVVFWL